jgi:ComF family protein
MPFDTGGTMVSAAAAADPPAYERARAVARYDGVMRDLIRDFKFHDQHHGRRLFGRWLADAGHDLLDDADVIVPVPMARLRLLWRRFNQSAELANELARLRSVPFRTDALVRTRRTRPQPGLSQSERIANVRGAFAVPSGARSAIAGRAVLLVDDVITTGATVSACATALKSAGARRVDVLALALVTDQALVTR